MSKGENRICVVVLGDFGRSPRMQYHAMALSSHGFEVDVVAYAGSRPHKKVHADPLIHVEENSMVEPPNFAKYVPRLLSYVLKVMWQTFVLFKTLLYITKPSHILVQNPPSITTLPVAVFICWLRRCKLVIDWHNYGYTVLGLTLGSEHLLVKLSNWIEGFFGGYGSYHFCVTRAMKEDLAANWGINATVLYDRPSEIFHPINLEEKHNFLCRFSEYCSEMKFSDGNDETKFTKVVNGQIFLKTPRPALVVSSTSWTPDEDFSILLTALDSYEASASEDLSLPNLICIVSGKGPMRAHYEREMKARNFQKVLILTAWLQAEDYPLLLASADLGVCLHKSTSGLDLPMKVVDMFGCGLPVCALTFSCLYELVKPGINGLTFSNSRQLAQHLTNIFRSFPNDDAEGVFQLEMFRQNLDGFRAVSWEESWKDLCWPVFKE